MTRRVAVMAVLVLVIAAVAAPRADVAPFPSWRIAANSTIEEAVQAGTTVYVAGAFTKIGTWVPAMSGLLDPTTLAFTPSTGCATYGGFPVYWRYTTDPSPTSLADGAGPLPLPAGTDLVRVGPDCRFDRRFRVVLPPGVQIDSSVTDIVEAGGHVYFHVTYYPVPLGPAAARAVVEVDGITGGLQRYWIDQAPSPLQLAGVTSAGQILAATRTATGLLVIGFFDPAAGGFDPRRTMPLDGRVMLAGSVVVVSLYGSGGEHVALDGATLTPLAQWPVVTGAVAVAAGAGRIFFWGQGTTIDGVATREIVAFDATTGARDLAWTPPALTATVGGYVNRLIVAAGRLIVTGDFSPGAPRDTMAALDAATGALDSWVFPFNSTFVQDFGGVLYVPEITARDRVARQGLAALDAATGAVLPWTSDAGFASALAVNAGAGHLYVGRRGSVGRVSLSTGTLDTTWRVDLLDRTAQPGAVSAIAVHGGQVYVGGLFSTARDTASPTWQPREDALAVSTGGTLTPWSPGLVSGCFAYTKVPYPAPCVYDVRVSEGRVVLHGALQSRDGAWSPARSLMAFAPDTGAIDSLVPPVDAGVVSAMAVDATGLYATTRTNPPLLAHVTSSAGARIVGPAGVIPFSPPDAIAVRDGRVYADVERDAVSGVATGNSVAWPGPVAVPGGVLARSTALTGTLGLFAAIAPVAPRTPIALAATLDGPRLTLRWAPGPGDLAPLVAPPPPGGTAATSHVVQASLTGGGPVVAEFDTASADPSFAVTSPTGTYFLRVRAKNAFGTSAPSAEFRVDVSPQAPSPPAATLGSVTGSVARVEWRAPPGGWAATGYRLEAGTAPGLTDIGTVPVSGTSFEASVPAGRYYVRVRAVNAIGSSAPGDEVVLDVP